MAGLAIHRVTKQFGDHRAVDDLSLEIAPGEFVALLGPSGCGKTTMLRMLAGFEQISSGTLSLNGTLLASDQHHMPPEQRNMAMVFQSYALWPHMSVADNVGYPLKLRRIQGSEYQRRVAHALEQVALTPYAQRAPQELSGGQRQRVALARCLVTDPDVVLLDEPLANLDRNLRASMEHSFVDFHRRTQATMVYVTHDQSEAMAMADRIAVMRDGALVQWATPETLYREPRSEWVARFIGQGSQLKVAGGAPGQQLNESALMQGLASPLTARTQPVLVRPEHIRIEANSPAPSSAHSPSPYDLTGRVERLTFRGERYELHLRLSTGEALLAYHHTALNEGQHVAVRLLEGWCLEHDQ